MKKLYLTRMGVASSTIKMILMEVSLYLSESDSKKNIIFISNELTSEELNQIYHFDDIIDMSKSFKIIQESDMSNFEFLKDVNNSIIIIDKLKISNISHVKHIYELLKDIPLDNIMYMRSQIRKDEDSVIDFIKENSMWLTIVDTIIESYIKDSEVKFKIIKSKR